MHLVTQLIDALALDAGNHTAAVNVVTWACDAAAGYARWTGLEDMSALRSSAPSAFRQLWEVRSLTSKGHYRTHPPKRSYATARLLAVPGPPPPHSPKTHPAGAPRGASRVPA